MPAKTKPRKAPKPTVLRDFFASLDEKTKGLLLLALNMEATRQIVAASLTPHGASLASFFLRDPLLPV
ncbi:MAG: hypothetical protein NTW21_41260 [Verrucomicrobia bacterium]|nr:hypothetical protein [Verrucomicrobiota bacterium]